MIGRCFLLISETSTFIFFVPLPPSLYPQLSQVDDYISYSSSMQVRIGRCFLE